MKRKQLLAASIALAASSLSLAQQAQIEEISVIGQFVPDEKRATDAVFQRGGFRRIYTHR
jgi:hypothetical protein